MPTYHAPRTKREDDLARFLKDADAESEKRRKINLALERYRELLRGLPAEEAMQLVNNALSGAIVAKKGQR